VRAARIGRRHEIRSPAASRHLRPPLTGSGHLGTRRQAEPGERHDPECRSWRPSAPPARTRTPACGEPAAVATAHRSNEVGDVSANTENRRALLRNRHLSHAIGGHPGQVRRARHSNRRSAWIAENRRQSPGIDGRPSRDEQQEIRAKWPRMPRIAPRRSPVRARLAPSRKPAAGRRVFAFSDRTPRDRRRRPVKFWSSGPPQARSLTRRQSPGASGRGARHDRALRRPWFEQGRDALAAILALRSWAWRASSKRWV
jgi:hypothetical protein